MIEKCYVIESVSFDPYGNLALEEHLLKVLPQNAILLYLWQNAHTVVIGRNQNAYREVNVSTFLQDGGRLARRLSGGGAVYHDLGNLNFTFIMPEEDFSVERQMRVIVEAVNRFGLKAEMTGRNDALVDGRKFSGNAYYHSGVNAYHHGTVLIDTDGAKMARYLNVSQKKLEAKGVASVKSRVCNLKELNRDITCEAMKDALQAAFQDVYGLKAERFDEGRIDQAQLTLIRRRIADEDYWLNRLCDYTLSCEERFAWGEVQIQLKIESGRVTEAAVYSDAMDETIAATIRNALLGAASFKDALAPLGTQAAADILAMLEANENGL